MTRRAKALARSLAIAAIIAAAVAAAALMTLTSGWFERQVRAQMISTVERATGGRVELGSFHYDWRNLSAAAAPFVLHGREPASSPPFFRAERVAFGLRIVSLFARKVDIASLDVQRPELRIQAAPDGSTNVPLPAGPASKSDAVERLLDLKVQRAAFSSGFVDYNSRRIPLDVKGEDVSLSLRFETGALRYAGEIGSPRVEALSPSLARPLAFAFKTGFAIGKDRVRFTAARLGMERSSLEFDGALTNFESPRGEFAIVARVFAGDLAAALKWPRPRAGNLAISGQAAVALQPFSYTFNGRVNGRNLDGVAFTAALAAAPGHIGLERLNASAFGGSFTGVFELSQWKLFRLEGAARGISVRQLAAAAGQGAIHLDGVASGPVQAQGVISPGGIRDLQARAKVELASGGAGVPLQGALDAAYDQRSGRLELGSSTLSLGSTRVELAGALGDTLQVHMVSRDLNELAAALRLIGEKPPESLPIALKNGTARFDGVVAGSRQDPHIAGRVELTRFIAGEREFDRMAANIDATRSRLEVHALALDRGALRVEGNGRLALTDWRPVASSALSAALSARGGDLAELVSEAGAKLPIAGAATVSLNLAGAWGAPEGAASIQARKATAYGEQLTAVRANVSYSGRTLRLVSGEAVLASGRLSAAGSYTHPGREWRDGQLQFNLTAASVALAGLETVQDFQKGASGELDGGARGSARIVNGEFELTELTGEARLRRAALDGRPYGSAILEARTNGSVLNVAASADLRGARVEASGEWRLSGEYPGRAEIRIPRLSVALLHDLAPGPHAREKLPFDGFVEGWARISAPLKNLDALKADVTLSSVELEASAETLRAPGAQLSELTLRNSKPVRFEATAKTLDIRDAEFVARDTTLSARGRVTFDRKSPWDVSVDGSVNLAILRIFNPDLLGAGVSIVKATVRGPLSEPQVDGRLELRNASLFLKDVPNGLDRANGVILFDRSRATVETLAAKTGGGSVTFQPGSFVGFRGPAAVYHVQASAEGVRYRSPEGASVTVGALLSLAGTAASSVLSGTVTVERAGFNSQTDVGGLLASTARPIEIAAAPSEYLRGIQLDVRVVSAQTLEIQTSLTRDVQAEANLRVRGPIEKPAVLGDITVNSGQIDFFGNRYAISRGEVHFYNPAKIEPILDMDLETRVRGITVDITFAGPLNKLNFSYRSDPPLETNQIVALLAVGRAPSAAGTLAGSQIIANENYLATGSNALLGQAIAPASGRLQRFFGVSHIKIDPQLTDLTSVPQARLTLEQQISKDITLTYITNLTRTQEQIVRVEWDVSRRWSVVALRDENGAFGIDVQYRKRFK